MARETSRDRRAKVAEMQAQQKKAERRRLMTIVGACLAVVVIIAGAVGFAVVSERNKDSEALQALSGDASAASCDPVTTDPASGSSDHVGPGTNQADVTRVDYTTVPPSSGKHFASPALDGRRVYTSSDAPAMENLVHNLEHGYTILWYDKSVESADAAKFDALQKQINALPDAGNKFIISPWDTSYGALPEGKKYALSHWSAKYDTSTGAVSDQAGHRQLCGGLSATVVEQFVKAHPWSSSPEPNAA